MLIPRFTLVLGIHIDLQFRISIFMTRHLINESWKGVEAICKLWTVRNRMEISI